jgi:sulfate permease, SulP family
MQITNKIHFRNLQGDLFGGLTAAIVSLPIALAFGVASGAGPVAGLYGAVCIGFFAALFGGTPTLISEPTGPMTVVFTGILAKLTATADSPEQGMAMAFTVAMLAGIFQIIFGSFRLGKYITMMPYSVISGFMSGIGVILVILQIAPFLGQKAPKGGVVGTIQNLPNLIANISIPETILAALTIAIIFLYPKQLKRFVPPQLVALVVGTIISLVLFQNAEINRIGEIPMGLPKLVFPTFKPDQITMMIVDGIMLGMLGCIDTLLTAVVADSITRTHHQSNKELIGQGIANIVSGLCGGLPGAGATMGTVVNIQTGAKTAVSGLTRALILLVVLLWAAGLAEPVPMSVLAGIALKVGLDILDWSFLKRSHKVSLNGTLIMYGVLFLTVFVDLIVAVGVGVFIANILTIEKLSNLHSESLKTVTDSDDEINLTPEENALLDEANNRVLLFYLSGPMIFGVSQAISREQTAMKEHDVLVLDLSDVPMLGVTASLAIENTVQEAVDNKREVFIVGIKPKVEARLKKLGLFNIVPPENLVQTRKEGLQLALNLVQGKSNNFESEIYN